MDELKDKKTLVLVASVKPDRYSNKAVKLLMENDVPTIALSRRNGAIDDLEFLVGKPIVEGVHTITLYLNPYNQQEFYSYILSLNPKRVLFNPGTEKPQLQVLLDQDKIHWEEACTLVLLRTNQY